MHAPELVATVLATLGEPADRVLRARSRILRGGVEAEHVVHVVGDYRDRMHRDRRVSFVVKSLAGPAKREAQIYTGYLRHHWGSLCPRLFGAEETTDGQTVLYLEALRRRRRWPWHDVANVARVLGALAALHIAGEGPHGGQVFPEWDYVAVLKNGATQGLECFERCTRDRDFAPLLQFRPSLRRMSDAIGATRRALLACRHLTECPLHGDVHSGNVLLRSGPTGEVPVFIDWARARMGSPLEDVSSWLQSLRYWAPEAARRHDTLFIRYLDARGLSPALLPELRAPYWIAAASNVLAGALTYHLTTSILARPGSAKRVNSFWCARDCLRIIRRADALWSS